MPLTREQTKYQSTNDTVFLPTVAIDRNLAVRGTSVFDNTVTFNNGLVVNQSSSIFGGTINEYSIVPGLHAGIQNGTPRLMFAPPGSTSSTNNWQIDVASGVFRWFTPGIVQMSLTPSTSGGTVSTNQITTSGNVAFGTNIGLARMVVNGATQFGNSGTASNNWHLTTEAGDGTLRFWNGNYGSGTERLRMASAGDIGIGTSTMTGKLNVSGAASGISGYFTDAVNSSLVIANLSGGVTLGTDAGGAIHLATNGAAVGNRRLSIDSAGQVGIGIAPTTFKFDVSGGAARFNSGSEWSIYHRFAGSTSTNRNHIMFQRDNAGAAVTSGFNLGGIGIAGFDGTNYGLGWNGGIELSGFAAETWTATARGTNFTITNTTIGTNTPTERLRINGDAFGTTTLSGNVIQNVNTTAKTAAYTLTTVDANTLVQMNGAFAFTVPLNSTTAFPTGTTINLLALTAGVSVTFTGGITSYATPGTKLRAAGSMATLIKLGTDTWVLSGDLTA